MADRRVGGVQRGMLVQLAARMRQRQGGVIGPGDGDDEGEGADLVVDDNCAVGHHLPFQRSFKSCANPPWQIM